MPGPVLEERPGSRLGLYGKLPTHGDFLTRRLPRSFIDPWDDWLQDCVGSSRETMGEGWLETYLTSPAWRFALSPGACGSQAVLGVVMPSVDRVGRYFPLTLAVVGPDFGSLARLPGTTIEWYGRVEALALESLAEEFDFPGWEERVAAVEPPELTAPPQQPAPAPGAGWRLPIGDADALEPGATLLIDQILGPRFHPVSLWWSSGSERVAPSLLVFGGLPAVTAYPALLDAQWVERGLNDLGAA